MPDRRQVLATGAAAAVAAMTPWPAVGGAFQLGGISGRVVSDGHLTVGLDRLVARHETPDVRAALASARIGSDGHRFAINEIGRAHV